jgi:hypothetical protein
MPSAARESRACLFITRTVIALLAFSIVLYGWLVAYGSLAHISMRNSPFMRTFGTTSSDTTPTILPAFKLNRTVLFRGGSKPFVVAIVAVWDEALVLPLSLDSTRHFVDEYIVIHKAGTDATYEVLQKCIEAWGLRVQYFLSNMTLREARMFAINLTSSYADVWIIQDGDEVFYDSGPMAVQNSIPLLFGAGYGAIRSKMVYLKHTLTTTEKDKYLSMSTERQDGHVRNGIILIDHPTFLRNDGPKSIIMPAPLAIDVPEHIGPAITLHAPWKFDVSIKHPLREFLRNSFLGWSLAGSKGRIEDWAIAHDSYHLKAMRSNRSGSLLQSAELYFRDVVPTFLQPYSEREWHEYPTSIRKYVDAGRLRGYEGGALL